MTEREYIQREWIAAIKLEIVARGSFASLSTIRGYADGALAGERPPWDTAEYRVKMGRCPCGADASGYTPQGTPECADPGCDAAINHEREAHHGP